VLQKPASVNGVRGGGRGTKVPPRHAHRGRCDDPPDLTRQVIAGPPSRTLIELSADSAMLVLGSRGHGGFAGLLLGSVSAACGEHAYCPVLIVHKRRSVVASEETP